MLIEDWRQSADAEVGQLLAEEAARWASRLSWDSSSALSITESARRSGVLPGFVARESGLLVGWTYFLVHDGIVRIGSLAGGRSDIVRALLDAVIESPEASIARRLQCFSFPDGGAVAAALSRRRFALERYLYLQVTDTSPCPPDARVPLRPWRGSDLPDATRLAARAYAGSVSAACFSPNGRLDEWAAYLSSLQATTVLGAFDDECSLVAVDPQGSAPVGMVLVTWVDAETAHVAQLAVDPAQRGRGVATALLDGAISAARDRGAARVTLLVAESNTPAQRLYRGRGFVERAVFVFGERARPTRANARAIERRAGLSA